MLKKHLLSLVLFFLLQAGIAPYYLVGRDGHVAVVDARGELLCTTDTPLATLLPADREAIVQGFPCADREALNRALENFCS